MSPMQNHSAYIALRKKFTTHMNGLSGINDPISKGFKISWSWLYAKFKDYRDEVVQDEDIHDFFFVIQKANEALNSEFHTPLSEHYNLVKLITKWVHESHPQANSHKQQGGNSIQGNNPIDSDGYKNIDVVIFSST
ncbi:hypothetical protein K435DRAFT_795342 [Dendrothele bispora CBS 962.96]|uniref:Uncharacterized protein n=1 Tax=Dendrothele bispora (strain CBS 962.96) TaxID=1314807 RepID=A0A4S8MAH4_DENBC|nr:hypothetical protein K435DRAFT_795342 [Dendrothele bispora CBS 962.96]